MKKDKKIIILISIIIILAVIFSFFQIRKSYLFNADNNGIIDGKAELINRLEKIEDKEERKKQIDYSVKQKVITQEELNHHSSGIFIERGSAVQVFFF